MTSDWKRVSDEDRRTLVRARADGILLHLYGAAVSAHYLDPESELLNRIRGAVGWAIPIATVNDSDGNVGPDWVRTVDAAFGYQRAPHTDHARSRSRGCFLIAWMAAWGTASGARHRPIPDPCEGRPDHGGATEPLEAAVRLAGGTGTRAGARRRHPQRDRQLGLR